MVTVDAEALRGLLGLRPGDELTDPTAAVRAVNEAEAIVQDDELRWLALDAEQQEGETNDQ